MSEEYTQIVEGCRRRDRKAQRALYDATAAMALGVCMRYAHDRTRAQDWMQDGYIRVFENIGKLKKPESLMSWVYQVMTNVCITALKREQERVPIDDVTSEIVVPPENPFADEEVVEALQKIMPSQRLVFNLIEVEDYTIEEVAKELKCTEVNVRALLSRAKSNMREIILKLRVKS